MLALIAAAAVLAVSAVAIVSLRGDDKPEITNELPGEDEQPASTPQTVYKPVKVEREFAKFVPRTQSVDEAADDDSDDADDGTSDGADGGDDTGSSEDEPEQDDSDDGTPGNSGDDKKHGLERAIEVHEINLARKQAQVEERNLNGNCHGHGDGHGLENSLEHLQENLAKHAGADAGAELDHADNGNGKAKGS